VIEQTISKVKEAEAKADEMVAEARAQAREIRQEAERQSKDMLEKAQEDSAARIKEARDKWLKSEQETIDALVASHDGSFAAPSGELAERMPQAVEAVKEFIYK
jgi:F0F1-type ATP synthase membrane subunit b/b'